MHIIAHNIRSLHNVGAIFRSADAFGVKKLYLTGYTPAPPRPEIAKVALGSELRVPWESRPSCLDLIQELRERGIKVLALETGPSSTPISNWSHGSDTSHFALLLGNEVSGIEPEVLAACDQIVAIPMPGKKRSLNVSVAAGIALFALTRPQE